ncbi:mediator complex, subunit Med20 [Cokeromyces recurvatus]|uniref:mediator complex, subunit Med20 n=1 Tax=Cokeromyces recurvatus TaxID=90255 RepID=UPI00221E8B91|nr:mediator complex, subunit Med20 [Cokeromyces recurvatus]KAI7907262.1 mediator complex, subunit Med20 [Cokeromyces recurvatus]
MGITCLVRWKNATGMRDFTYIAEHITKTLHGKNIGPWSLSFKVFRDVDSTMNNNNNARQMTLKDSKLLYQVSLAQQPRHVYCMVEGSVVVEAEKEMEIILPRLKNLWQLRQNVTIEGTSYEIGDFTLRVANILLGSAYKGLLLEIDYHPCSTPNNARQLFQEFVESIVPSTAQLSCEYEYNYEQVGLSNYEFTIAHTSYQYMQLFRNDGLF